MKAEAMLDLEELPKLVWRPHPMSSQALALACPCNEILYDGTRGPGKTETQLARFRRNVGKGYGRFWRGVIFDREYKNLDDLIVKSKRFFESFNDGARFLSSNSELKWVWPTGEELLFRQIKKESEYWNYHGHEYPFIGWNELTKYPTSALYEAMKSTLRTSFVPTLHSPVDPDTGVMNVLPPIPLEIFSTTNPYGPGHAWVRDYFIDIAPAGVPYVTETRVFDPRTQAEVVVRMSRVRIFGSYKENRFLTAEYVASLHQITDPNKREAWLFGNWDITAGGALDDLWGDHVILPRFKIPHNWRVTRSLDWGSSHPFSIGWWAIANGEDIKHKGKRISIPRGSLIRIDEWYGTEKIGTNKGLKLAARKVAQGVKEREAALKAAGWIAPDADIEKGPADNQIGDMHEADERTIRQKMEDEDVYWSESNKSAGSRIAGLQLLRDRLEHSKDLEGPAFFVMEHCKAARAILPRLPRDEDNPDDVDTEAEDHLYDDSRYMVLDIDRSVRIEPLRK